jgi:hypothetical protein
MGIFDGDSMLGWPIMQGCCHWRRVALEVPRNPGANTIGRKNTLARAFGSIMAAGIQFLSSTQSVGGVSQQIRKLTTRQVFSATTVNTDLPIYVHWADLDCL